MWQDLLTAIALLLVIEGILPFLSPDGMRKIMRVMSETDNHSLRISGFVSMVVGVILLYLVH